MEVDQAFRQPCTLPWDGSPRWSRVLALPAPMLLAVLAVPQALLELLALLLHVDVGFCACSIFMIVPGVLIKSMQATAPLHPDARAFRS